MHPDVVVTSLNHLLHSSACLLSIKCMNYTTAQENYSLTLDIEAKNGMFILQALYPKFEI